MDIIAQYRKKTKRSAKIFARSQKYHVNGVNHNIRFFEPYPFVTESAKGRHLTDADSNRYVDYWMGHWSLILGHAPPAVRAALKGQLDSGWMFGTVNSSTMRLSELIQSAVPAAQKIRYVSSGTEAAMYAVRLARSHTGKKTVAKIDGGWHGYTSELLKTVNWPFDVPESSGLVNEDHIVSLPYNDIEGSIEILQSVGDDLACTVIEPLLGGGGCIPADADYMRAIQEFVQKKGALFLLDEIVTGFRLGYGCAYPGMRLDPDIVLLGKIAGGGLSIGVICGRKEVMELSNTSSLGKAERSYIGGGTFSANPATMTAGAATLEVLQKNKARLYPKINGMGEKLRCEIPKLFDGRAKVTGRGSLFMTHFPRGENDGIKSSADAAECDSALLRRYHFEMMTRDGIFFLPGKMGAISGAHTRADIAAMLEATGRFSAGM